MQKKLIGLILTVLGVVGTFLALVPYLVEGSRDYNSKNINLYGFISTIIFFTGIILMLPGKRTNPR